MKICGVVAEYNPFHSGHALHLSQTRAILGQDTAIVCVMSGNFVQRGGIALLDKYTRAEVAVKCGIDLVLELPLSAALSSAEGFARGAVGALDAFGSVGYLSFGSECGSARALQKCAALLNNRLVDAVFKRAMREGLSYAGAREKSVAEYDPAAGSLLSSPNNILGLEYCRALDETGSHITPLSIRRRGADHDAAEVSDGIASASYIRNLVAKGALDACAPLMPQISFQALQDACVTGAASTDNTRFDAAILSHLRRMDAEQLAEYDRRDEGFPNRLFHAIQTGANFEEVCMYAQTRRYPLSRIRRALLRAFLDIPYFAMQEPVSYLRVLALSATGRELLRNCPSQVPIITKPLHEKKLPDSLQPVVQRDVRADELFSLALPSSQFHIGGSHFRKTPYCAKE